MSLNITDECINYNLCAPVCPNDAIYEGTGIYVIEPKKCDEHVDHYDQPQCVVVCPVAGIVADQDT